ncbi:hypothetical protein LCGC14_1293030 [marine sediment metagenome]|uniref:Uncharacterized protein n=1 Tax=marine sediment metagenome TaxID=412755 RepID=A0A0F9N8D4_9ZZZZ
MIYMKSRKIFYLLMVLFFFGLLLVFYIYYCNWDYFLDTIANEEGSLIVITIIGIRILVLTGMMAILFKKWFEQEVQYLSDIPFLFGLFFLILVFGKLIDLFYNIMYFHLTDTLFLIILKFRFILMWLNMIPLFLMTFEIWLFSLSLKNRKLFKIVVIKTMKLQDNTYLTSVKYKLIEFIAISELIITLMMPNIETVSSIIILAIPSFLLVSWLFYKAFKLQRLKKINTRIIATGFLLYSISTITRVIWQMFFGKTVLYIFISEIVDVGIFLVIFYALLKKVKEVVIIKNQLEPYNKNI